MKRTMWEPAIACHTDKLKGETRVLQTCWYLVLAGWRLVRHKLRKCKLRHRIALTTSREDNCKRHGHRHSTSAQVDSLAHKAKGNEDVSWRGQAERIRWKLRDRRDDGSTTSAKGRQRGEREVADNSWRTRRQRGKGISESDIGRGYSCRGILQR